MTRRLTTVTVAWLIAGSVGFANAGTWTGQISDSLCGPSHKSMAEQLVPPLTDAECTKQCIEANGKYVLVDDNQKVLEIANQDFGGLKDYAGRRVKLTGELNGQAITISKIEADSKQ